MLNFLYVLLSPFKTNCVLHIRDLLQKKSCNKNPSTKSTILGDGKEAGVYMGELKQRDQKDGGVWNGRGVKETGCCVIFLNKKQNRYKGLFWFADLTCLWMVERGERKVLRRIWFALFYTESDTLSTSRGSLSFFFRFWWRVSGPGWDEQNKNSQQFPHQNLTCCHFFFSVSKQSKCVYFIRGLRWFTPLDKTKVELWGWKYAIKCLCQKMTDYMSF